MKKSLLIDPWFKIILTVGLISAIIFALAIIVTSNLYLCLEFDCFNNLFTIFKFPIAIFSTTLASAGFYAVIYRSNQTEEQIAELKSQNIKADEQIAELKRQNIFSNYIAHKKEFISILEQIEHDMPLKFGNKGLLYSKLFPGNNPIQVYFDSSHQIGNQNGKTILNMVVNNYNQSIQKIHQLFDETVTNEGILDEKTFAKQINRIMSINLSFNIKLQNPIRVREKYQHLFIPGCWPVQQQGIYIDYLRIVIETFLNYCLPSGNKSIKILKLDFIQWVDMSSDQLKDNIVRSS